MLSYGLRYCSIFCLEACIKECSYYKQLGYCKERIKNKCSKRIIFVIAMQTFDDFKLNQKESIQKGTILSQFYE
jgi:hypothetical protein